MSVFIEAVGFGVAAGAVIALGAVGFTVQFGISNVLNITYGALMTLAAYLGYALLSVGVGVWAALAVAAAGIAVASAGFNRLLIAPVRRRGTGFVGVVIVTVAAGIIIQYCIVAIAGPDTVSYGQQAGGTIRAAGFVITTSQLIIIGLTVAAMLALHLLLTRTQLGRAMRATSANPVVARSCGVRTERIIDVTWLISGALCGAAGVALAITTVTFDFTLGPIFLIYMIAAAVLGGIGQPYGAMLGGLVVGVGTQVAAAYTSPAYQDVYAFGLLILMLLIRPRGLLAAGTASARRLAEGRRVHTIGAAAYYVVVMLVYLGTDLLAAWGLNLEFGVAGVVNFAYIVLVAAGAYLYAVFTLGPPAAMGGFQQYIIGGRLPAAAAVALAALICGGLGCLIGVTGLKRLRADYQAMVMLVISILATTIVGADTGLFNGNAGLSLIPNPLASVDPARRGWYYVAVVGLVCTAGYLVLRRFTTGPLGRALRAVREDEDAAISVGKNVVGLRLAVQAVGGVYAGLSGALLAGFIGGWSPSAWGYVETLALLTAIIVGGLGNDAGVLLGVVIVPVLILQGVQFLPQIESAPQLAGDLGWIILGLLTIAFVFTRPQGLIPERRPHHDMPAVPADTGIPRAEAGVPRAEAGPPLADAGVPALAAGAGSAGLAAIIAVRPDASSARADPGDGGRAPILIVDGLVKRYGGVHAVDGASFTAAVGGITGLIGPNGAGKSTVLGLVSGFVRPDAGRIAFDGRDVAALPAHRRARLGIVRTFQLPREFRALTTIENLLVAAPGQRGESAAGVAAGRWLWRRDEDELVEAAHGLLRLFGMAEAADERAGRLSGGQKRMLEVMRALMARPRLLLLDEPMAGLAPALAERLEAACRQLAGAGMSILLVEHELGVVERLCETVVVMHQGKVISEGRMAELRTRKEVQDAYVVG